MAEIRIEGKSVYGQSAGHLYLVFVDDDGQEYVIRGGPDDAHPETWIENGPWGHIVIQTGLLSNSRDTRTLSDGTVETREQRGSTVIDLEGRDPHAVWDQMMQHAAGIAAAGLDYDLFGTGEMQNSNSVVASAMHNEWGFFMAGAHRRDGSCTLQPYRALDGQVRLGVQEVYCYASVNVTAASLLPTGSRT